jgi:hypothetical protein
MVELAIILPLLALLMVLTVDVGRVFFGWVAVTNAVRIGANEAAIDPEPWASGGSDPTYYERMSADLDAINCDMDVNDDGVIDAADIPDPVFINRVETADPHEFGDHVRVSLSCRFSLITPLADAILGGGVDVSSESTFSVIGAQINGIPIPAEPPTSPCLPSERIVPNLIGMSVNTARDRWDSAGFTGAFSPSDPTFDADGVTAQTATPAASAGSCLAYYAAMTVTHSAPESCTASNINVPYLIGLTLATARTTWTDAGFSGGSFTPAAGDDGKVVLTQTVSPSTAPGGCAPPTASVTVTFGEPSDPPVPTCTAPDMVKDTATVAAQEWTTAGFTGAFTTQPTNKNSWIVKAQNLVGGQDYACTVSVIVYLEKN